MVDGSSMMRGAHAVRNASSIPLPLVVHHPHLTRVTSFLVAFSTAIDILGRVLVAVAVLLGIVALLDWLVRTRRLNPFNPVARFMRRAVDPLIVPIENRVVRAGGMPQSAPWWALVFVVLLGIVALEGLRFIRNQIGVAVATGSQGPRGVLFLLVHWTFAVLQIALIVRVVSSWFRLSPYSPWVRWSFALTEPILRPLRAVIPPLGMLDLSPIVAYFLLRIVESLIVGALFR